MQQEERESQGVLPLRLSYCTWGNDTKKEGKKDKAQKEDTEEKNLPFPLSNYTKNLKNADLAFLSLSSQDLFTVSPAFIPHPFSQYPCNE